MFISCARNLAVLTIASLTLVGCFEEKPKEETHSVSWFKENSAARAEVVKSCSDNPGELKNSPNCVNALAAEQQSTSGSLKKITNW